MKGGGAREGVRNLGSSACLLLGGFSARGKKLLPLERDVEESGVKGAR